MKVMLLFPPQFEPTQPYSSLPSLTAVLRKDGNEVVQKDINLESFYYLISPSFILKCNQKLKVLISDLESRNFLNLHEQKNYSMAVRAVATSNYVQKNISRAVETMRTKDMFKDFKQYSDALAIIKQALQIVSAAFYPSNIELYETRLGANPASSDDAYITALDPNINPYLEWFESKILPEVESFSPDVVGLSVSFPDQFVSALSLANLIKQKFPKKFIVMGGAFITRVIKHITNPEKLFKFINAAVIGEGESAFCELIKRINSSKDVNGIKNLVTFKNGRLHVGEQYREMFRDLPTPDFEGLPLDNYLAPQLVLPLSTARGCYYGKCTFCAHFHPHKDFKNKNPNQVYSILQNLSKKYNTTYFSFNDECIQPSSMKHFSELIIQNQENFAWYTFARFEKELDFSALKKLRMGGCKILMFGMESADEGVLARMSKEISLPIVKKTLQNLSKVGIAIRLSVLVGFPGEIKKESEVTLDFFKKNHNLLDRNFFAPPISRFKLLKDTTIDTDPSKFGIKILNHQKDEDLERDQHFRIDKGMTMEQAENQYYKLVNFFVNNFHAYKQMPDNKAHIFLYKCYADEGILIPYTKKAINPSEGIVCIKSKFDLEQIHYNILWLENESTLRRLKEGTSLYRIKQGLIQNTPERNVYCNPKSYLFNLLTMETFESDHISN